MLSGSTRFHANGDATRSSGPGGAAIGIATVAGGVAANQAIRRGLTRLATEGGLRLVAPPAALCGDNGAMIAWAGLERLRLGLTDGFDAPPRPRWLLETRGETLPPALPESAA